MSANELVIGQNAAFKQAPAPVAVPEAKVRAAIELLRAAVQEHGKVVYANSLGAESMVLTDLIWTHVPQIEHIQQMRLSAACMKKPTSCSSGSSAATSGACVFTTLIPLRWNPTRRKTA